MKIFCFKKEILAQGRYFLLKFHMFFPQIKVVLNMKHLSHSWWLCQGGSRDPEKIIYKLKQ